MDRALWKKLLAEAPPRDAATAELFGKRLIEWTDERLEMWYAERLQREPALREELGESVGEFLAGVAKANFACLGRVPVARRTAYLCEALRRRMARHFTEEGKRQEHLCSLPDFQAGEDDEEHELDLDNFVSADPGPEERAVRRAMWEEALAVVATMPPARRAVFLHRYEEGMTAREAAEHLRMPLGTVQWHDREILIRLKRHFGPNGP